MDNVIWVMDSDFCEECGALLDYFGCCPNGCDFLFPGEEDEDEPDLDPDNLDFDENGKYIGG